MIKIGCHLSVAKGFTNMAKQALNIGANTFQFFTRNPRGGNAKEIDIDDINSFLDICKSNNFGKIIAHAPYTLNPCSSDKKVREFAFKVMKEDMERMNNLPGNLYNFHPGSHTGQGIEKGIEFIIDFINENVKPEHKTTILIETMAGKGTEIGGRFEDIGKIIKCVDKSIDIGVCFDTCHVFDAGYDIVNNLDYVLKEFDKNIGIDYIKAVHINDSKNAIGSHKDRHEKIGYGNIGINAFKNIVNNKYLKDVPFCLETPNDIDGYAKEIDMIKMFTQYS